MEGQLPVSEKQERADRILQNHGTMEELLAEADRHWTEFVRIGPPGR